MRGFSIIMRCLKIFLLLLLVTGCGTLSYKQTYHHVAPLEYPAVKKTRVFEYSEVDIDEIYKVLFGDYMILGQANFIGSYEDPLEVKKFAASKGADVLITSSHYLDVRRTMMPVTMPTTTISTVSTYGANPLHGTAIGYGAQTTMVPVLSTRYEQQGLYLKNVNHIRPIWSQTVDDYERDGNSPYDGFWHNGQYQLELYTNGDYLIAILSDSPKDKSLGKEWEQGDVKWRFDLQTKVGVFLMNNKQPMPASFSINRFNHFEIKTAPKDLIFSFEKVR